ncbi:MAG: hypothetical protein K0S51_2094 [Bacillales bacterium]|jgi:hypothetical protein|nr:hypothetical protein [Bacillales bacterium]
MRKYTIPLFLLMLNIIIITIVFKIDVYLRLKTMQDYQTLPNLQLSVLIYSIFGLFIGVIKLVENSKDSGKWIINLGLLFSLGIPSLYFTFFVTIHSYITPGIYIIFIYQILGVNTFKVFAVLLGYSITACFEKR